MLFDYSAAKAALKEAGHTVSTGPQVLATDIKEIVKFGRVKFGMSEVAVRKGIANPTLLPEGFPGVAAVPVAETVEDPVSVSEAAPAQEATPTEDAPKAKKVKKGVDETAAQDAPAGEQAAQ